MRRALAVCAFALAALPAVAQAATVRVVGLEGTDYVFDLGENAGGEDVSTQYTVRSSPSESSKKRIDGFSLAKVLDKATDPAGNAFDDLSYYYVEVERPNGGVVRLSKNQVREQGAFPEGPPVVYAQGQNVGFLRPSKGPNDSNSGDTFVAGGELVVREAGPPKVQLEASTVTPKRGQPVTFEATIEGQGSGQNLSVSWRFGDGSTASDQLRVTHTYRRKGCYMATVGVYENGDDVGSAGVQVLVETPRSKCDSKDGPGGNPDDKPNGKPDDDRGPGKGNGDGGDNGRGDGDGDAPSPRGSDEPRDRPSRPDRREGGDPVQGELLDDVRGAPAAPAAEAKPAAPPQTQSDPVSDESGMSVPGAAIGVLLSAGLLGLGALRELDRLDGSALARIKNFDWRWPWS